MVNIKIKDVNIKNKWDYQKGKLLLEMQGLTGELLTNEQTNYLKKEITLFLWENIKKQFPKITEFTTGKTGNFNKKEEENFKTPIINIHGSFYLQLISLNNKNNWCWEEVSLEPYRFYFNEEGYFKDLVINAINKAIIKQDAIKETFKDLIIALNDTKTEETFITIDKTGKVDLKKVDTTII